MGLVDCVSVAPIYFDLCTYKKYLLPKALEFFLPLCVKLSANESRGFGSFFCIRSFERRGGTGEQLQPAALNIE